MEEKYWYAILIAGVVIGFSFVFYGIFSLEVKRIENMKQTLKSQVEALQTLCQDLSFYKNNWADCSWIGIKPPVQ